MDEKSESKERTPEFKIRMVERYLNGECQAAAIRREHGLSKTTFSWWVHLYKTFGAECFNHGVTPTHYPVELKRKVCEEYIAGGSSLTMLCARYKVRSCDIIRLWLKKYNAHEDFKEPRPGRASLMGSGRPTSHAERVEIAEWCIAHSYDYMGSASRYRVPYGDVYSWVRKYTEHGPAGLEDRRGRRRKPEELDEAGRLRLELKKLEAKNKWLQMENDLLKKLQELERGQEEEQAHMQQ